MNVFITGGLKDPVTVLICWFIIWWSNTEQPIKLLDNVSFCCFTLYWNIVPFNLTLKMLIRVEIQGLWSVVMLTWAAPKFRYTVPFRWASVGIDVCRYFSSPHHTTTPDMGWNQTWWLQVIILPSSWFPKETRQVFLLSSFDAFVSTGVLVLQWLYLQQRWTSAVLKLIIGYYRRS